MNYNLIDNETFQRWKIQLSLALDERRNCFGLLFTSHDTAYRISDQIVVYSHRASGCASGSLPSRNVLFGWFFFLHLRDLSRLHNRRRCRHRYFICARALTYLIIMTGLCTKTVEKQFGTSRLPSRITNITMLQIKETEWRERFPFHFVFDDHVKWNSKSQDGEKQLKSRSTWNESDYAIGEIIIFICRCSRRCLNILMRNLRWW